MVRKAIMLASAAYCKGTRKIGKLAGVAVARAPDRQQEESIQALLLQKRQIDSKTGIKSLFLVQARPLRSWQTLSMNKR